MSVYLRNWVICLITNAIVFLIGWGCIVPDQLMDNTHLFGLIGDVEVIRGNTAVVFGMCAVLSTLVLITGLVEAIIEDFRRPCCSTRFERPKKSPKISGMRVEPTPEKVDEDKDPKTPTMD